MPAGIYHRKIRPVVIPIGPSIAYVPLTHGLYALIDTNDAERVGIFNWHARWDKSSRAFYAWTTGRKLPYQAVSMHRFILGEGKEGETPDHRKVEATLDNRRCNLRFADHAQQNCNRRIHSNNKSGYKGVFWHNRDRAWIAKITLHGRLQWSGRFNDPLSAYNARCEEVRRLHGEFARIA
jgi:hypothetical protein